MTAESCLFTTDDYKKSIVCIVHSWSLPTLSLTTSQTYSSVDMRECRVDDNCLWVYHYMHQEVICSLINSKLMITASQSL